MISKVQFALLNNSYSILSSLREYVCWTAPDFRRAIDSINFFLKPGAFFFTVLLSFKNQLVKYF